jgi:hypothetical protein
MWRRAPLALTIAMAPVVLAFGLSAALYSARPADAIPYASDEIAYWNQIAAFERAGFDAGYTTVEERPSRVSATRFGPHGPAFPVLYGVVARAAGWDYASGPIFGALAFILAATLWQLATPAPPLLATAVMLSFWPVVLSALNTMQEPLHFAFACVFAVLFVRALTEPRPSQAWLALAATLIIVASLVRPVWALPAVPLAGLLCRRWGRRAAWAGAVAAALGAGTLYAVFITLAAPYPLTDPLLTRLSASPVSGAVAIVRRMVFDGVPRWLSFDAEPLAILYRYQLLAVAVAAGVWWYRSRTAARPLLAFASLTAFITFAATLAVGEVGAWRDYRATTPLLLMVLLMTASVRTSLAWIAVAMNVLMLVPAYRTFQAFQGPRFEPDRRAAIETFAREVGRHMRFETDGSPWANSVLVHVDQYRYPLLGLPRGMGISGVLTWDRVAAPPRSRYLILSARDLGEIQGRFRLARLDATTLGDLYENLDWAAAHAP